MNTCFLILLVAAVQADDGKIPEALRRLERAVLGPRTAEIEWSYRSSSYKGTPATHKTRIAGERRIETITSHKRYANEEGTFEVPSTVLIYRSPEVCYERKDDSGRAKILPAEATSLLTTNLWKLSIMYMTDGSGPRTVQEALYGLPDDTYTRRYSSEIVDGLHVVTAQVSEERAYRWWIDPKQGWWATRMQHLKNGEVLEEQSVKLRQWGDTWFPVATDYGYGGVDIHAASFDQPEHQQELTLRDIGIVVGTTIKDLRERGTPVMMWDGTRAIPDREYYRLQHAGEIADSPMLKQQAEIGKRRARLIGNAKRVTDAPPPGSVAVRQAPPRPATQPSGRIVEVKTFESQWERYTREFIARYSLKDSQEQKAWSILKKCREQGNSYVKRHRAELDDLEARVAELSKSTAAADREQLAAARKRFGEKLAPVDAIFENQLKPRLEKLPTRKQRAAVAEARKGKDK